MDKLISLDLAGSLEGYGTTDEQTCELCLEAIMEGLESHVEAQPNSKLCEVNLSRNK